MPNHLRKQIKSKSIEANSYHKRTTYNDHNDRGNSNILDVDDDDDVNYYYVVIISVKCFPQSI